MCIKSAYNVKSSHCCMLKLQCLLRKRSPVVFLIPWGCRDGTMINCPIVCNNDILSLVAYTNNNMILLCLYGSSKTSLDTCFFLKGKCDLIRDGNLVSDISFSQRY